MWAMKAVKCKYTKEELDGKPVFTVRYPKPGQFRSQTHDGLLEIIFYYLHPDRPGGDKIEVTQEMADTIEPCGGIDSPLSTFRMTL